MKLKEKQNYIDVTKEWMNKSKRFSNVLDAKYYEHNNKRYYVDNKNVVLDYSRHEKEVAKLLTKTFGGTIYMMPRINIPEGIKTPDYMWNNEYWDLKIVRGNSKNTIDSILKDNKTQAKNFILIINSNNIQKYINQIKSIYNNRYRKWIKNIIALNHNKIILLYEKRD